MFNSIKCVDYTKYFFLNWLLAIWCIGCQNKDTVSLRWRNGPSGVFPSRDQILVCRVVVDPKCDLQPSRRSVGHSLCQLVRRRVELSSLPSGKEGKLSPTHTHSLTRSHNHFAFLSLSDEGEQRKMYRRGEITTEIRKEQMRVVTSDVRILAFPSLHFISLLSGFWKEKGKE